MNPLQMMLGQYAGNPMLKRAQKMAEGKSEDELKQVAINLCKQRGIDLTTAFNQFQQMMTGGR